VAEEVIVGEAMDVGFMEIDIVVCANWVRIVEVSAKMIDDVLELSIPWLASDVGGAGWDAVEMTVVVMMAMATGF
jgi:hypothetical protein